MEFTGAFRKQQEEFLGVTLKQGEIFRGDQGNGISEGLGFRP